MQFIFGPLLIVLGVLMMRYTVQITNFTGDIDWAEQYLGGGTAAGTYTLWRIVGLVLALLGAMWLFGLLGLIGSLFHAAAPGLAQPQ